MQALEKNRLDFVRHTSEGKIDLDQYYQFIVVTSKKVSRSPSAPEISRRNHLQVQFTKTFPWIRFESRLDLVFFFIALTTLLPIIIGKFALGVNDFNRYLSVSFISTVLSFVILFFDSDILRAFVWVNLPGFLVTGIYWYMTAPFILSIFLSHLPIQILQGYHIIRVRSHGTRWWMIPIALLLWLTYLSVMDLFNPKYFFGEFPYIYDSMTCIFVLSALFGMVFFYILNRVQKEDNVVIVNGFVLV